MWHTVMKANSCPFQSISCNVLKSLLATIRNGLFNLVLIALQSSWVMLVDFKKRPQKEIGWYKVRWSWWPVATLHTAITKESPEESCGFFSQCRRSPHFAKSSNSVNSTPAKVRTGSTDIDNFPQELYPQRTMAVSSFSREWGAPNTNYSRIQNCHVMCVGLTAPHCTVVTVNYPVRLRFSVAPCYFLILRPRHFLQHCVLESPSCMFFS